MGQGDARAIGDDVAVAEVLQAADELLAALEDDVWRKAGFVAQNIDGAQDVLGFRRADEGGVAKAGEIHWRIAGDGAVQRGEDDVFVGAEDVAGAFLGQAARVGDGEINVAGEKPGFEAGAAIDGVVHDDVGIGFEKAGQPVLDVGGIDGADADAAGLVFAQGVKLGGDVVEFSEDGLGVGENNFAVVVEDDVAALAVEKPGAELALDARKGVGERRLGHAQRLGGFGDVLAFGDGDEVVELEQVHGRLLSKEGCKNGRVA